MASAQTVLAATLTASAPVVEPSNVPDQRRRAAPAVGHGENLDTIAAQEVHPTEGVSREDVPSSPTAVVRPSARVCSNGFDGLSQLFAKAVRSGGVSCGVPVIRGFRLLRCGRMEPDS